MTNNTSGGADRPRLGCVYRPQLAPEKLADAARAADGAGLDEMWLWEDCFLFGGISSAAIALANSTRLMIGVGVLPAPLRNVAATAMEISTLHRAFPGRVRVGLGHGVQDWMAQIGAKVASPMTLMREYLSCLRAVLQGRTVTFNGTYVSLTDVTLEWAPVGNCELLLAAGGPKTLRLSGELANGTVLTSGTSAAGVRAAMAHVNGSRRLSECRDPHAVVTYILCATGDAAHEEIAREIARWGFPDSPDIHVSGDASAIARAVQPWIEAGSNTVVLQPAPEVAIEDFLSYAGREIQPLIKSTAHQ